MRYCLKTNKQTNKTKTKTKNKSRYFLRDDILLSVFWFVCACAHIYMHAHMHAHTRFMVSMIPFMLHQGLALDVLITAVTLPSANQPLILAEWITEQPFRHAPTHDICIFLVRD